MLTVKFIFQVLLATAALSAPTSAIASEIGTLTPKEICDKFLGSVNKDTCIYQAGDFPVFLPNLIGDLPMQIIADEYNKCLKQHDVTDDQPYYIPGVKYLKLDGLPELYKCINAQVFDLSKIHPEGYRICTSISSYSAQLKTTFGATVQAPFYGAIMFCHHRPVFGNNAHTQRACFHKLDLFPLTNYSEAYGGYDVPLNREEEFESCLNNGLQ